MIKAIVGIVAVMAASIGSVGVAQATVGVDIHATDPDTVQIDLIGDNGANDLTVVSTSTSLTVSGTALDPNPASPASAAADGCTAGSGGSVVCALPADKDIEIEVETLGGIDTINLAGAGGREFSYSSIEGGAGNDSMIGSPFDDIFEDSGAYGGGSDLINAGPGDDDIFMFDSTVDQLGSDCGADDDYIQSDPLDPFVANCETGTPQTGGPGPGGGGGGNTPPPATPASNVFTPGKFDGKTGKLTISVPGPGTVTTGPAASGSASKKKKKKAAALIAKATTTVSAGSVTVPVKLTSAGKKQLKKKKKLKAKVAITFTPTGGTAAVKTASVTFKKK